ncbi:site-specific integrase [Moritella dasanensis]|uniref:site-specific integrase n=1 Tax=Moritella dasanensis TaxID=428031 RepID=UPI0002D3ED61|nr:site-specific integrase [Moritella dasanensis]
MTGCMDIKHYQRSDKVIGGRYQANDYYYTTLQVSWRPSVEIVVNGDTGKELLRLAEDDEPTLIEVHALIDPNGRVVSEASQYLYHLKKKRRKDTAPIAKALLQYYRFLDELDLKYDVFPEEEEERPTYMFAEHLKELVAGIPELCENGESKSDEYGNPIIAQKLALSTGKNRMRSVISYYKYLRRTGFIILNRFDDPFEVINIHLPIRKQSGTPREGHMLSHIYNKQNQTQPDGSRTTAGMRTVETTDIMGGFPPEQSKEAHDTLRPMTPSHKELFERELIRLPIEKQLCFRLGLESGLRLSEFTTFPRSVIYRPSDNQEIKIQIGPLFNGCMTKFSKEGGQAPISAGLMLDLYDYTVSEFRLQLDKKGLHNGRLFLSRYGKPFAQNTLQTTYSQYRKYLQSIDPTWDYTIHELRSTFATYRLEDKLDNGMSASLALQELSKDMRHEDIKDTLKYATFRDVRIVRKSHAEHMNERMEDAMERGNG